MSNILYNQQTKKSVFSCFVFSLVDAPLEYHAGVHIETLQTQTQAMLREHLIFDSLKFGKILLLIGDLRNVKKKTIQRLYFGGNSHNLGGNSHNFGRNSHNFDALFGLIVAEVFHPQAPYHRSYWFPVLEFHFHCQVRSNVHELRQHRNWDSGKTCGQNIPVHFYVYFVHGKTAELSRKR